MSTRIKLFFLVLGILMLLLSAPIIGGKDETVDDQAIKLIATPRNSQVKPGGEAQINLIAINLGDESKKIFIPSDVKMDTGYDCIGSYFAAKDGGFWRSAELHIFKSTTNPKMVELPPGGFREFEIKVKLFPDRNPSRQACLFSIGLLGGERSNEIAIWSDLRPADE